MEQSPFSEAGRFSTSPTIFRTWWNMEVRYRIHESHHLLLSWARSIQSRSHPTSWRYILVLSHLLRLGLLSGLFPSGFPTKAPYARLLSLSNWFAHSDGVWWGVQIMKLRIVQCSPLPFYHVPVRPKYLPWHPVLAHPQPTLLPDVRDQI